MNECIQYVLCNYLTNKHLCRSLVVAMIHIKELSISGSFPAINIDGALCIDHLRLNVGVERVEYEEVLKDICAIVVRTPGFYQSECFWHTQFWVHVHL